MKIDLVTFETFDEAEPVVSILRREWEILYVCLISITVFVDCDTDGYVETGSPPHLLAFKSKWVGDPN